VLFRSRKRILRSLDITVNKNEEVAAIASSIFSATGI